MFAIVCVVILSAVFGMAYYRICSNFANEITKKVKKLTEDLKED